MLNIAVFASGRGSNLLAILDAIKEKKINAEVKAVVSNKQSCGAAEIAEQNSISLFIIGKPDREVSVTYSELCKSFESLNINLIVLAGFLKKIPDDFIEAFPNIIINIHPALLPSFGGRGMFGMNVHNAVYNSSAQISGVTVHFVDSIYDHGKIIAQRAVDISGVETPEEIAGKVLKVEHELLPFVIQKFSENKVIQRDNRIYLLD